MSFWFLIQLQPGLELDQIIVATSTRLSFACIEICLFTLFRRSSSNPGSKTNSTIDRFFQELSSSSIPPYVYPKVPPAFPSRIPIEIFPWIQKFLKKYFLGYSLVINPIGNFSRDFPNSSRFFLKKILQVLY